MIFIKLLRTGFEFGSFGIGSDRSANCAKTTAPNVHNICGMNKFGGLGA